MCAGNGMHSLHTHELLGNLHNSLEIVSCQDDQCSTGIQQQWSATADKVLHPACTSLSRSCSSNHLLMSRSSDRIQQFSNAFCPRSSPSWPPVRTVLAISCRCRRFLRLPPPATTRPSRTMRRPLSLTGTMPRCTSS